MSDREFLLQSIRDLDAEWEAGDIDESDYRALRDDYTAQAAAVIRAEQAERAGRAEGGDPPEPPVTLPASPPNRRRGRRRLAAAVGGSLALAGLAGWLIAGAAGSRGSGQQITGTAGLTGIPGRDPRLDQAQQLFIKGKAVDAIKLYDTILRGNPNPVEQAEALAYRGWMLRLAGLSDQGLASLDAAEKADPSYPDAHFFRGVILFEDKGDAADAVKELRFFLASDPPPDALPRAEQELQKALQAGGPSVATTVDPRTNPAIAPNFGPTTTTAP